MTDNIVDIPPGAGRLSQSERIENRQIVLEHLLDKSGVLDSGELSGKSVIAIGTGVDAAEAPLVKKHGARHVVAIESDPRITAAPPGVDKYYNKDAFAMLPTGQYNKGQVVTFFGIQTGGEAQTLPELLQIFAKKSSKPSSIIVTMDDTSQEKFDKITGDLTSQFSKTSFYEDPITGQSIFWGKY